jgi:hypothetical protein
MHRLIYKSRAKSGIDKETFRDILYTSVALNRKHDISGALIASRTHYLQFLEGEHDIVADTFTRIKEDGRHTDIVLIAFSSIEKKLFVNWRMRGFGLFDLNLELEQQLKEKYGAEEGSIRLPDEEKAALALAKDVDMISISAK